MPTPFRAVLLGEEPLLIRCAELTMARGHLVAAVVSASERVVQWAEAQGIDVFPDWQSGEATFSAHPFEYLLSITNLRVLPARCLALPRVGAVNFHDGPLPRYGGLHAPAWALMAQEPEHGISWHVMVEQADAGPLLLQRRFPIAPAESSLSLNRRCFAEAIESFPELLDLLEHSVGNGGLTGPAQPPDADSWHGPADRPVALGVLDLSRSAGELSALVRALDFGAAANPLAIPRLLANGRTVAVQALEVLPGAGGAPGTVRQVSPEGVTVSAGDADVLLSGLRGLDGGTLSGPEALRHLGVSVGDRLRTPPLARLEEAATLLRKAARHDAWWGARLAALSPLELEVVPPPVPSAAPAAADTSPTPPSGARQLSLHPLPAARNAHAAVAGFVALLARRSGRRSFDVAIRSDGLIGAPAGLEPFLAPVAPLAVHCAPGDRLADIERHLATELAQLERRGAPLRDVALRDPALRTQRHRPAGMHAPQFEQLLADTVRVHLLAGDTLLHDANACAGAPPLTLRVHANGTRALAFDPARCDAATVEELARQLLALEASPDSAFDAVPLLAPDAQRRLLEWGTGPEQPVPDTLVHEQFEAQVERTPDAVALCAGNETISYRALDERANQLAHHLRAIGVAPDTLVGLCCVRSIDLVVGLLGILKAGAAYVPLDPLYPAERLAFMADDAQLTTVVTHTPAAAALPAGGVQRVMLDHEADRIGERPVRALRDGAPAELPRGRRLAYCIYTSGSTGRPKGVMVEHRNVVAFFGATDLRLGTAPATWLAVTSVSFDISVLELCWTLARGHRVVLYNATPVASAPLDFSLFYFSADAGDGPDDGPQRGAPDRYRLLLDGARFADTHGFTAVWTPERHFHAFGGLYPNASVTGAAVAAVTSRVAVRAGSCVLPLHHPARVAEEWAVVDNLSNGRVGVSFAAGWQPDDFVFQPQNYEQAKARTVELMDTVRQLWRGEAVTFDGPRGPVEVRTQPRPVQPELPVWFTTAGNPESYELAGRLGVNVLTHLLGQSVEELAEKIVRYHAAWREAGHAGRGKVSLMVHTFLGHDADAVKETVRAPLTAYLGTSVSLIRGYAAAFPTFRNRPDGTAANLDFASLSAAEMESLLEYAFERYYASSGLFGTLADGEQFVARLRGAGVDEVACLIDFGIDADTVLAHLDVLDALRRRVNGVPDVADVSVQGEAVGSGNSPVAHPSASVAELVARHDVTHLQCTPSMAAMLLADAADRESLSGLTAMCVGGEACPPALAHALRTLVRGDVHNMYGPTETTIWSSMHTLDDRAGSVPLGRPLANNHLVVLDAFGQVAPIDSAGELCIGGAQVVRGYWRRPELTAERFVHEVPSGWPAGRLYRTGDLARWTGSGTLEFLGRTDQQVKVRGHRIEIGEIEACIAASPLVEAVAVVARTLPSPAGTMPDVRLVACVVPKRDGFAGDAVQLERKLRALVKTSLPEVMHPAHWELWEALPLTPNGKVDRTALATTTALPDAPVAAPAAATATDGVASATAHVAPQAVVRELEAHITRLWQEVLQRSQVGVQENFFDLGGHSLLAVQVHSRLKLELQCDLSITDLFRYPTVRTLAQKLAQSRPTPAPHSELANAPAPGLDTSPLAPMAAEQPPAGDGAGRAAQRRELAARRTRRPVA